MLIMIIKLYMYWLKENNVQISVGKHHRINMIIVVIHYYCGLGATRSKELYNKAVVGADREINNK